jgi:GNAT superfamily N-acetyltransferase
MNQPDSQGPSDSAASGDDTVQEREIIERPTPEDVPVLLGLIKEFAASLDPPDTVTMTEELLHKALFSDPPSVEAIVIRAGDETCGFATFWPAFVTWTGRQSLYIDSIYVRPERRKGAIAMQVYTYLWRLAESRGYREIEGMIDIKDRELASFYRALGARAEESLVYFIDIEEVTSTRNSQR